MACRSSPTSLESTDMVGRGRSLAQETTENGSFNCGQLISDGKQASNRICESVHLTLAGGGACGEARQAGPQIALGVCDGFDQLRPSGSRLSHVSPHCCGKQDGWQSWEGRGPGKHKRATLISTGARGIGLFLAEIRASWQARWRGGASNKHSDQADMQS